MKLCMYRYLFGVELAFALAIGLLDRLEAFFGPAIILGSSNR
jgi:hypothetical protein